MRINFDHINSCPIDSDIIEESGLILQKFHSKADSFHKLGRSSKAKIEKSRIFLANNLNVSPSELFFQYDAITQTIQLIDYCILILDKKHIFTSVFEDNRVLNYLKILKNNKKIKLSFVPENSLGEININKLNTIFETRTNVFLSLSHANRFNGMLLPVKDMINICAKNKVLFHLNINATIGKYHIDIQKIKADFISFDFAQQYGNRNTGIFYFNQSIMIKDEEYHKLKVIYKESETDDVAETTAIARAFYNSTNSLHKNMKQLKSVRNYLISQLSDKFSLNQILSSYNKEGLYTTLSYFFPESIFGNYIAEKLDLNNISVARLNYPFKLNGEKAEFIRFSLGKDNNTDEVDFLSTILNNLKKANGK